MLPRSREAAEPLTAVPPALRTRIAALSYAAERLGSAWDSLAAEAAEPNSFGERWFTAASLHTADTDTMRMLEVWLGHEDDGALIGLLPLCIAPRYGRLPVRHVQNWLHFHSFLGTPLVAAGHEEAFWGAALAALDAADWVPGFLHLAELAEDGPVHRGLVAAAAAQRRPCDSVYRTTRAFLESDLGPQDYYEATVRKKKRKELKRLANRLAELGAITHETLAAAADVPAWCDSFLALETSGWKGRAGTALALTPATDRFFREAVAGAFAAGRLDFRSLNLDGRPIAMLANFIAAPGSFSFKTAFDESYAQYSPGVLIQLANYEVLDRPNVRWMDSCAVENHPMINSLWGERRSLVRVTVALKGARRQLLFRLCRTAETGSAALRAHMSKTRPGETMADEDG